MAQAPTTERPDVLEQRERQPREPSPVTPTGPTGPTEKEGQGRLFLRPIIAAALSAMACGLVTGGIFGVWSARLLGGFAACFGAFWAWLTLRYRNREALLIGLLPLAALAIGTLFVIPGGGDPNRLPQLVTEAIEGGRLLRPPVPFDPGWRPIMMLVISLLGFGAVWVGTALGRPRLAIVVPLPLLGLVAITQPDEGEFIAGVLAFVPLLASLAVLFSGDSIRASELTRQFELRRALRGGAATVATLAILFVAGRTNFLFPEPVFDPSEQPQKPKALPLSANIDRVLFEIKSDAGITGPWKTGTLDVYDGVAWRLPPYNVKRFVPLPEDGVVNSKLAPALAWNVQFTIRDLGNTGTLPGVATPAKITKPPSLSLSFDPRADVFRMKEGRVPADVVYSIALPAYPDATTLSQASRPIGDLSTTLQIPKPPDSVTRLLSGAPDAPAWERLDFVRKRLQSVAVASGSGVPKDMPPSRIEEILEGNHEGSPFELVAAEAMLARWAGIPARIGFGFDGVNDENGVLTVRPRNAAQWLEVYFEGHGWIPLTAAPPKAKTELSTDPDSRFNPTILPSDEVAVELYLPIKVVTPKLLYQRLREQLFAAIPYVLIAIAAYVGSPGAIKIYRRWKRRRWAEWIGPRAQIAVEYTEFRDLCNDLGVGDPVDTSLEFLRKVVPDPQHSELAWLMARATYGDLAAGVTDKEARDAEELSGSLRRRVLRAQPMWSRAIAFVSKASLREPYLDEVPNVTPFEPLRGVSALVRRLVPSRRRIPSKRKASRVPAPAGSNATSNGRRVA